jgi:hypothetical protein
MGDVMTCLDVLCVAVHERERLRELLCEMRDIEGLAAKDVDHRQV